MGYAVPSPNEPRTCTQGLTRPSSRVGRQLFLRLVTIGDGDEWGRRRVRAAEVLGLDVDVVALQTVIHRFGDHRLLSFDRDHTTGSPTLEVAHEALLTEWPRLRDAIVEARVDVRRRASLGAAFVEWDEAERNPDYLFSGTRLAEYEEWSVSSTIALTSAEQLFLDEAIDRRESENQVDAERTAREHALDRRARVRTWALAAVVTAMAGVGAWLLFFAGPGEDPPRVARVEVGFSADFFLDQMENGWNQAQREFDLTFDEKLTPVSDTSAELLDLVRTEPDLIVVDTLFGDATELEDVVRATPDQLFAIPDRWDEDPTEPGHVRVRIARRLVLGWRGGGA